MLILTSNTPVEFKTDRGCQVAVGEGMPLIRETFSDSTALDLDHIVPLKFAHGHGGDKLSQDISQTFANDPQNLLLIPSKKRVINRMQKACTG